MRLYAKDLIHAVNFIIHDQYRLASAGTTAVVAPLLAHRVHVIPPQTQEQSMPYDEENNTHTKRALAGDGHRQCTLVTARGGSAVPQSHR